MEFVEKIAGIYIQVFKVIVVLLIAICAFVGIIALGTSAPIGVFLVTFIVAPLLIITAFGTGAVFILIYEHLKSIDGKLN